MVILPHSHGVDTIEGYFHPGGMYGGHSGYYTYYDYCPLCHHSDCLLINPKGTYEGEITCGRCDADYDGCTGYDKSAYGARGQLERYYEPEPEPTVSKMEIVQPAPTPLEIAKNCFLNNEIL